MKALLIRENGLSEAVDFPESEKLEWYYKTIGCSLVDIVIPYGIQEIAVDYDLKSILNKFCLIVDDEALLKEEPKINPIASLLYGIDTHDQPLCGNVIVAANKYTGDGIETVGISNNDMMLLQVCINTLIQKHNEVEHGRHGRH